MACGGSSLLAARSNHGIMTFGIVRDSVTLLERKRYEGRAAVMGLVPTSFHYQTTGGLFRFFLGFLGPAAPLQFNQKPTCDEVKKALD